MPPRIHHITHAYYTSINYGLIVIMDPHNDQLQVGLMPQLVEHCTGNLPAEVEKYNFFWTGFITRCFFRAFVVVVFVVVIVVVENAWYSGHYFLLLLFSLALVSYDTVSFWKNQPALHHVVWFSKDMRHSSSLRRDSHESIISYVLNGIKGRWDISLWLHWWCQTYFKSQLPILRFCRVMLVCQDFIDPTITGTNFMDLVPFATHPDLFPSQYSIPVEFVCMLEDVS